VRASLIGTVDSQRLYNGSAVFRRKPECGEGKVGWLVCGRRSTLEACGPGWIVLVDVRVIIGPFAMSHSNLGKSSAF
jgi:hypothetical protein